jgi:hypothetical protein
LATDDEARCRKGTGTDRPADSRTQRLRDALRANLRKRKGQLRDRMGKEEE